LVVNGAGAFEVGGPEGDNGLSGKKLVMDAYGPRVPIGGGAWSGKDFFKADRAGGLHARRLAKLLVTLGLTREATVTLGFFPGDHEGRVLRVVADGLDVERASRVAQLLDLSLAYSGARGTDDRDLLEFARWGHFADAEPWWERLPREGTAVARNEERHSQ
jgi:S-adenosylmethionine synthetase